MKFLIRWVFPALISSIAFTGVLLKKAIPDLLSDANFDYNEFWVVLIATFLGGIASGLAYSIYRPMFRRLGRIIGDALTGAITMNFYFLAIYNVLQYNDFHQGLKDGLFLLLLFATLIGALVGWQFNITGLENGLINYTRRQLINTD
ncbi:hypothetical protein [Fulvivirga ligni]|uniref:hypothetical protein n=1 Tax=Fulvivirga ligni TaxID=2904246 RepID=UPI001F3BCB8A|nr:hypothetical protein [Fulvivirga ligni]UII20286.1 hypothetical protein LVD16_20805 [Fulvivirga ligni]